MVASISARVVFILCVVSINTSWATYDLDEKFAELDRKLDFLIAHVGDGSVAPPTTSRPTTSGISSLDSWITPLEVWRQPDGDNIKFTIKLKARGNGMVKWWDHTMGESFSMPTTHITSSTDVQEVSHITKLSEETYFRVHVMFFYSQRSNSVADLMMEFSNTNVTEDMTSAVTLPPFGIEPLGDLVYEEGRNITIRLRVPPTDRNGHFTYDTINCQVYLVDEENEVVNQYYQPEQDMFELLEMDNQTDYTLLTVRLNTAQYDTSGFVELSVGNTDESDTSLVHGIKLSKSLVLRPSSQPGPLPDGFLGFDIRPYQPTENGVTKVTCSAEHNCSIGCTAVGEDVVDFTISKVESDGSRTPLDTISSELSYLRDYVSVKGIVFPSKPSGTERFECRVENFSGKFNIRTIEVTYFVQLDILEDQSEVRVLNENEASNIRRLAVVCTVKGSPAPNITFTIEQYGSYDYSLAPDEIEIDGNIITATKFVTYDMSDPNGWYGEYKGKLSSAACTAEYSNGDAGPWGYERYDFTVPDEIQD